MNAALNIESLKISMWIVMWNSNDWLRITLKESMKYVIDEWMTLNILYFLFKFLRLILCGSQLRMRFPFIQVYSVVCQSVLN